MGDLMGRNEYARHRKCAPNAVKKAEDDGRIRAAVKRDESGKFLGIDWRAADKLWALNTDPVQAGRSGQVLGAPGAAQTSELQLGDVPPRTEPPAAADPEEGQQESYYVARAKREEYAAKEAELKYLKSIELLVSAEEVRTISARRYRALRDSLLAVVEQEAPVLEGLPAVQIRERLTRAFHKVLHELADHARAEAARRDPERLAA